MRDIPSTVAECELCGISDVRVEFPVLQEAFRHEGLGVRITTVVARVSPANVQSPEQPSCEPVKKLN